MIRTPMLAAGLLLALGACGGEQAATAAPCDRTILAQQFPWLFGASLAREVRLEEGVRLAAGTPIVAAPGQDGQMCIQTVGEEGLVGGWASLDVIQTLDPLPETAETWAGVWTTDEARIEATPTGQGVRIAGRYGAAEPAFDFDTSNPVNGLAFSEAGCGLSLARLGQFLVAVDNRMCVTGGGSFTGIYRREGG